MGPVLLDKEYRIRRGESVKSFFGSWWSLEDGGVVVANGLRRKKQATRKPQMSGVFTREHNMRVRFPCTRQQQLHRQRSTLK